MNRSEESNRARSLSALVEELKDEEDEDLLVLKKCPSEKKQHSRYQKKYIKSLSAEGKKIATIVSLVAVYRVLTNQCGSGFMKVILILDS